MRKLYFILLGLGRFVFLLMSDLIKSIIKSYLNERQINEKGQLDGTLHFCKGLLNIDPNHKIEKSIYPTYAIMEKYRGLSQKIYYRVLVNKQDSKYYLIKNKKDCQSYYFKEPIGAINVYYSIIQELTNYFANIIEFTFILEGNSIENYIIHLNNISFLHIQSLLQNILEQYRYTDFEHHQYFNPIV